MSNSSIIAILPKASIRPEKIVFYTQVVKEKYKPSFDITTIGGTPAAMPESNKHEMKLSDKAKKNIQTKIKWLYALSKKKDVTTFAGKEIFNHRMSFITLTLPSSQKNTTAEIIKHCLNQFLTECRERFDLQNYVWRLEYQKNGNLHIHMVSDTFIEYWMARKIWNRCINKFGYVDAYSKLRDSLSLSEYINKFNKGHKDDFNTVEKRYAYGRSTLWMSPNTVDVRNVSSIKNIGRYLSKYLSKSDDLNINLFDDPDIVKLNNSRLWFCSRSLSKVNAIEEFMEGTSNEFHKMMSSIKNYKEQICDYCKIWYFNIEEQGYEFLHYYNKLLNDYALYTGYRRLPEPIPI